MKDLTNKQISRCSKAITGKYFLGSKKLGKYDFSYVKLQGENRIHDNINK